MCGRYRLSRRKQIIEEHFDAISGEEDWSPRYNVAPTQLVPVIRRRSKKPEHELSLLRWGLIPSWATDPGIGAKTINARAETVMTTASFRAPFRTQRCILPADGFYEWQRHGKTRQPYCFEVGDGKLFGFAGLWDTWIDPQGKAIESCTILTTAPNALLAGIHDRMPVILHPDEYDSWLTAAAGGFANSALRLLIPFTGAMRRYPVSTRINHVQNDDVECATAVELDAQAQGKLFG